MKKKFLTALIGATIAIQSLGFSVMNVNAVVTTAPKSNTSTTTSTTAALDPVVTTSKWEKVSSETAGDVNDDGTFDIADVIMTQKWLVGAGTLKNHKNADIYFDGRINVLDLALMKKRLINTEKSQKKCLLSVETTYDGYGIAGQHLGNGKFENDFEIVEGDILYENYSGHWSFSADGQSAASVIAKITAINEAGVTVLVRDADSGKETESVIKYGEDRKVPSNHITWDGINYEHHIKFFN